jgi:hypothetical protein
MSAESKSLINKNFTHKVILNNGAEFTTNINEQDEKVEFIYLDKLNARQYSAIYSFNNDVFCNIVPRFIKCTIEDLLISNEYVLKVKELNVEIIFHHAVAKQRLPLLVILNLQFLKKEEITFCLDAIKAQNKQTQYEIAILKNALTQNTNKVKIILSNISDSCFSCKNPDDKHIIKIPNYFINEVNSRVLNNLAKISSVQVRKIASMMRIEVELELFSKDSRYYLCYMAKSEIKQKKYSNFSCNIINSNNVINFGSGNITDPSFSHMQNKAGSKIIDVNLVLLDRKIKNGNFKKSNNALIGPDGHVYFLDNQFPLFNYNNIMKSVMIDDNEINNMINEDVKEHNNNRDLLYSIDEN